MKLCPPIFVVDDISVLLLCWSPPVLVGELSPPSCAQGEEAGGETGGSMETDVRRH